MVFKLKMHCITGTARAINANHLLATAVLDFAEPMSINALFLMGGTVVAGLIEDIALMKNRSQRHPFLVDVDRQVILFEAQHNREMIIETRECIACRKCFNEILIFEDLIESDSVLRLLAFTYLV